MAGAPGDPTPLGTLSFETRDLQSWLEIRKECPHCFEPSISGSPEDLLSWFIHHTRVCETLIVDTSDPTALFTVKTCERCQLVVSLALYAEHEHVCQDGLLPGVSMAGLAAQTAAAAATELDSIQRQASVYASRKKHRLELLVGCPESADASRVALHAACAGNHARTMAMEAVHAIQCENAVGECF